MRIYLSADIRDFLSASAKMHLENRLAEFIAKTLAVSMRDLAENGARRVIGNGGFGNGKDRKKTLFICRRNATYFHITSLITTIRIRHERHKIIQPIFK